MPAVALPSTCEDIDMLITGLGDATCPVRVTGDGQNRHTTKHTHTHTLNQVNMYILLLQIATCTSHHSTDNTQYYANMLPCDSGVAAGVSQMAFPTADQLTYIPHASLSAACLSLFTNIWFLKYKFVSPVLFHCLNFCLYFCPSAHMFLFITVSWGKKCQFLISLSFLTHYS